jgi:hypothetical protein
MLDEAFGQGNLWRAPSSKAKVVGIEKDMALIDVGAKTEGRVAIREFSGPGRGGEIKVGDEVEVYLERIENALGEAVLSRDKARREESWGKLEKAFNATRRSRASSSIRSRAASRSISTARSRSCRAPGRHPADPRRHAADERQSAVPDPQDGSPPRQHRRVAPHRFWKRPAPSSARSWCRTSKRARSSTAW